ncbi:hypothetical protein Tco_1347398, partial [Tanacetum coccineum]
MEAATLFDDVTTVRSLAGVLIAANVTSLVQTALITDKSIKWMMRLFLSSFRRDVRDGAERQQWDDLSSIMNSVVLSSSKDRWTCDLSG